ncbi:MAG: hypothetical protein GY765_33775, partial [bacterium]|nr:hypothetical protein [bacterium]
PTGPVIHRVTGIGLFHIRARSGYEYRVTDVHKITAFLPVDPRFHGFRPHGFKGTEAVA